MSTSTGHDSSRVTLIDDRGNVHDATKAALRYVTIRQKAVRANLAWLASGDDTLLRKRDDYLFRSVEIVTTVRDLLGHNASKRFAIEADRVFGPVTFWTE